MKSGIFQMTNEEYHALPAISSSHLVLAREALRKFWFKSQFNPQRAAQKETVALRVGRAMHTSLLEPELFNQKYKAIPELKDYPKALYYFDDLKARCAALGVNTRNMRKADLEDNLVACDPESMVWSWFMQEFNEGLKLGKYVAIPKQEHELIKAMAEALADEVIELEDTDTTFTMRDVFTHGQAEETFVWQEPTTGLWLKVRSDWRLGKNLIFEYRTARDASPQGFSREVVKRNYHLRGAMYWQVIQQVTGDPQRFVYIAQEKEEPFLCGGYEQRQTDLEAGWVLVLHLLTLIKKCIDKGAEDKRNWPSYNGGKISPLELSDYSMQA